MPMSPKQAYELGLEDGFSDSCNVNGFNSQEAFAYRKGFAAGIKNRESAIAQGYQVPQEQQFIFCEDWDSQ